MERGPRKVFYCSKASIPILKCSLAILSQGKFQQPWSHAVLSPHSRSDSPAFPSWSHHSVLFHVSRRKIQIPLILSFRELSDFCCSAYCWQSVRLLLLNPSSKFSFTLKTVSLLEGILRLAVMVTGCLSHQMVILNENFLLVSLLTFIHLSEREDL